MTDIETFAHATARELADRLAAHITDDEIDALADRAADLLVRPVMPHPRTNRPIPWPAF